MNYKNFTKKLNLPDGVTAPRELNYEDIVAKPLTRDDLHADIAAVNSSLDIIRATRGGSWPQEAVSEEFDLLDLAWHEREFRDGNSLAYVIYDTDGIYIGCFYLYGIGVRTELTNENIDSDVDASWWVTQTAYDRGYYEKLKQALDKWLVEDFQFNSILYSNKLSPKSK